MSVTFDDGYENNACVALDVLKKYNIPATIFVTTGFVGRNLKYGQFIWTDYIYLLLKGSIYKNIDLSEYGIGKFCLSTDKQVIDASVKIRSKLKSIHNKKKEAIIQIISDRTGGRLSENCKDFFGPLSWSQINEMKDTGLVSIGAHTVSHPILSKMDIDESDEEILRSKVAIEKEIGCPVYAFAYPNGSHDDINEEVVKIVSNYFSYAVSTEEGFIDSTSDPFFLNRIAVGNDMPLWKFKLHLSGTIYFIKRVLKYAKF